ncbi:hypothetical protein H8Z60_19885 [Mycolicibacterium fortuitum]|nr:hypothetical protein [Mycolicibacterium fortuitum]
MVSSPASSAPIHLETAMSFWIIGTDHLVAPLKARCICTKDSTDGCPFHGEVVRVEVQS